MTLTSRRVATHIDAIERAWAAFTAAADPHVIVELTRIQLAIEH